MKRQVVVVGAGPGGSSAAFYIAKKGLDVLLIDKETWPRDKVCGDSYQASLAPILKDMGVYEEMKAANAGDVAIVKQIGPGEEEAIFPLDHTDWSMPRRIGDDIIRRGALSGGADFLQNFEATELIIKKGRVRGIKGLYQNQEAVVEADVTVIANGSHSALARQLGITCDDPELYMYCSRQYFEGFENMKPGTVVELYDPDCMPGDPGNYGMTTGWIGCLDPSGTKGSVGFCVPEKLLRARDMSIDQYFNWYVKNTKTGQKYLGNARPVDELKGWRLPSCKQIEKNYAAGALVIGDAAAAAECAYFYGISPAMFGGRIAGDVLAEAFKKNDFSEASLSVFQKLLGDQLNPTWASMAAMRFNLINNREIMRKLIKYANELPGYPNNTFSFVLGRFMKEVLKMGEHKVTMDAIATKDQKD